MWRQMLRVGLCLSLVSGLAGCQSAVPNAPQSRGSLKISVQFPKKGFATQLIRPETKVIYVLTYRGDLSLEQPQIYGPITPQNAQVRLHQLLAGEQKVLAAAYDGENHILTAGRSLARIQANSTNQASLELQEDYTTRLAPTELAFLNGLRVKLPDTAAALPTDLQPQAAAAEHGITRALAESAAKAAVNYQATPAAESEPPQAEPRAARHDSRSSSGNSGRSSAQGIDPAVALPEPAEPLIAPGQASQTADGPAGDKPKAGPENRPRLDPSLGAKSDRPEEGADQAKQDSEQESEPADKGDKDQKDAGHKKTSDKEGKADRDDNQGDKDKKSSNRGKGSRHSGSGKKH